jgi:hypothetical protein
MMTSYEDIVTSQKGLALFSLALSSANMTRPTGPGFAQGPTQSASVGDNPNRHRESEGNYEPTQHGGLKMDGTPDKRVKESNMSEEGERSSLCWVSLIDSQIEAAQRLWWFIRDSRRLAQGYMYCLVSS